MELERASNSSLLPFQGQEKFQQLATPAFASSILGSASSSVVVLASATNHMDGAVFNESSAGSMIPSTPIYQFNQQLPWWGGHQPASASLGMTPMFGQQLESYYGGSGAIIDPAMLELVKSKQAYPLCCQTNTEYWLTIIKGVPKRGRPNHSHDCRSRKESQEKKQRTEAGKKKQSEQGDAVDNGVNGTQ
jgi:hypothetical protein